LTEVVLAMIQDATEKKKAEEAQFRYASIVDSSEDAIASATLDGVIVTWNRGAQRMFGYSESEVVGKSVSILVPPELSGEEDRILLTLKRGGRIEQFETVRVSKTGTRINVSLSISPIKDSTGTIVGFSGIARDITERKRAEEVRFRHASIVESSEDAIISKNLDGVITGWNAGAERMFGYTESEALGQPIAILIPRQLQDEENKILETLKAGKRIGHYETIRLTKAGTKVNVSLSISPIKDSTGRVVGFSKIARDTTEQKRAEEALSNLTRKLVEAQEQERARLARELHDDITQRLALLAIELEHLKENPSEAKSRIQELQKQTIEISNDVQALSHDLHSSKLEYLGVAAGIKSWCKEFGERRAMRIECSHDVRSPVPAEIGLCLFRVLQEALHNAAKHSGVKRIEVQLYEESGALHLIVRDFGKGFDVAAALKGKGLGLTSMRERVRLANGTIEIESKLKSGTTIHIRVPLRAKNALQRAAG
jgi:PAS domain S-box-containing protein